MRKFLFLKKKNAAGEKNQQLTKKSSSMWLHAWELNRSCLHWLNKDTLFSFGSKAAAQAEGKWGYKYSEPANVRRVHFAEVLKYLT